MMAQNNQDFLSPEANLLLSRFSSYNNPMYLNQMTSMHVQNQPSQNLENNNNTSTNEINYETTVENNIMNETQNFENNIENNENDEKKEENYIDPEHEALEKKKSDEENNPDQEEGDNLSDVTDEPNEEVQFNNYLLAQYEKVKRVKNKWKVSLKGCIVQKDKKEYVCGKIHGELSREW